MCNSITALIKLSTLKDQSLKLSSSLDFSEQVSDFLLRALSKGFGLISVLNDGNLKVSLGHLTLKGVLQGLDSSVDSITDVHIVCVRLLEEGASLGRALAQSSCLPAVESARSFDLENLRTMLLVVATDDHTNSEGSHTS